MGRTRKVLTYEDVVYINRRMLEDSPDDEFVEYNDNQFDPDALRGTLEQCQGHLYGQMLYPGGIERASFVGYRIIEGHLFKNGTKRTGWETCRQILKRHSYRFMFSTKEEYDREGIEITKLIADHKQVSLEEFTDWVRSRTILIQRPRLRR